MLKESLWECIQRFTQAALEMLSAMAKNLISASMQGLREGDFFHSLAKKPPWDYDKLLAWAEK